MKQLLLLLACAPLFIIGCTSASSEPDVQATAHWSPPTYGTPVVRYIIQHQVEDGLWSTLASDVTDTAYVCTLSFMDRHRVRVAGIDSLDRQGPFSLPSEYYAPYDSIPGLATNLRWEQ